MLKNRQIPSHEYIVVISVILKYKKDQSLRCLFDKSIAKSCIVEHQNDC